VGHPRRGAAWLKDTGLALDADGFIQVTDTLQTVTDPAIFAAGDIASMVNHPLEKAGVFAVRQGPPLARNLRLRVQGAPLKPYHPQRRWLALISTGDQYAVASRGWLGFAGAWVWRWKDHIDRTFMRKFQDLEPMDARPAQAAPAVVRLLLARRARCSSHPKNRCKPSPPLPCAAAAAVPRWEPPCCRAL
jgi:selenide,water dikinase